MTQILSILYNPPSPLFNLIELSFLNELNFALHSPEGRIIYNFYIVQYCELFQET